MVCLAVGNCSRAARSACSSALQQRTVSQRAAAQMQQRAAPTQSRQPTQHACVLRSRHFTLRTATPFIHAVGLGGA
eukprot:3167945-Alexandrium_andersonii.AAC.1